MVAIIGIISDGLPFSPQICDLLGTDTGLMHTPSSQQGYACMHRHTCMHGRLYIKHEPGTLKAAVGPQYMCVHTLPNLPSVPCAYISIHMHNIPPLISSNQPLIHHI